MENAELSRFLEYLDDNKTRDEFTELIDKKVKEINEKYGEEIMYCINHDDDIRYDERIKNSEEIAKNLLKEGVSIDIISKTTKLSKEEVERLAKSLNLEKS